MAIILFLIIILILAAFAYYYFNYRPIVVIEKSLKINLPINSKIQKYQFDYLGGYFDAKISIDPQYVNDIKTQFNNLYGESNRNEFPNFKNTCSWWDLNTKEVETYYSTFLSGSRTLFSPKSHEV